MLTIQSALNPVWANLENTQITLDVKFEEFQEILPFTADPLDPMEYGVELYNRAKAGEFGIIADYVAPNTPKPDQPTTTGLQTI